MSGIEEVQIDNIMLSRDKTEEVVVGYYTSSHFYLLDVEFRRGEAKHTQKIKRRFDHFFQLRTWLLAYETGFKVPSLPPKDFTLKINFFNSPDSMKLQNRKFWIERFIETVQQSPCLRGTFYFQQFATLDDQ